ncbi:MAG: HAMP domain-containing histidine kinase [Pseudomonadota bacterium]|nr:HAMP domain-containing histidine kinase [Pseudomonadota bacterium]
MSASDALPPGLEALLDEAACALVQTDDKGLVRRANRIFCNWLGYASEELVGQRSIQDLLSVGCRVFHHMHSLPMLQRQGSISEVRVDLVRKDGQMLPMVLNARRHEKQGVCVHEFALFVAQERDRYEQELILSRDRLETMVERARQLEAQARERALCAEQMMGIVSHDLRNPLSAILLNAELLGKSDMTPNQSNVLARIVLAADRANRLIAGLLDLTQARLGSGLAVSPVPLDLHATVWAAVQELSQAYPGRDLRHVRHGQGSCTADADRLVQLLGNLVSNAMAYSFAASPITVTSTVEDAFFSISVQNQGTPIPEHVRGELFHLMVRGSEDAKPSRSVGLGLFIVSEIAKAHGGAVSLSSTLENGTVFTAVFPKRS